MFRNIVSVKPKVGIYFLAVVLCMTIASSEVANSANGSVTYGYDQLGRVVTAFYDTGVCLIYTYDANGNRTSQTVKVSGSGLTIWGCFNWNSANWNLP